jgi:tetratricopeptide (TPR) repeat protein
MNEEKFTKLVLDFERAILEYNPKKLEEIYNEFKKINYDEKFVNYYIALCVFNLIFMEDKFNRIEYLNEAINYVKKSLEVDKKFADGLGLLAGLYALKAGINIKEGFVYGPKVTQLLRKALEIEPDNPRLYYFIGLVYAVKPTAFGGNPKKAIEEFNKAISLFENGKGRNWPIRWGYIETLSLLSIAYENLGYKEKLNEIYEKIENYKKEYAS